MKRAEEVGRQRLQGRAKLVNAPATMSVIDERARIETSPAQNYRRPPALGARPERHPDVGARHQPDEPPGDLHPGQLAARAARRPLDLPRLLRAHAVGLRAPPTPSEIKQIEVVRGPASAVWGANALTGVVNIITKTPREAEGSASILDAAASSTATRGSRECGRRRLRSAAAASPTPGRPTTPGPTGSTARLLQLRPVLAPDGLRSARLPSAGSDSLHADRQRRDPSGAIRSAALPTRPTRNRLGAGLRERGTSQPKFDAARRPGAAQRRPHHLQRRLLPARRASSTPASVPSTSRAGRTWRYGRVAYTKSALKIARLRELPGRRGAQPARRATRTRAGRCSSTSRPRPTTSRSGTRTCSAGNHILTYGGNARRNNFDISLAPNGEDRTEFGAYFQDEIFFDKFRFDARRPRGQVRQHRGPGVLAARERRCSSPRRRTPSASPSTAPSARRPSSTTTWTRTSPVHRPIIDLAPLTPLVPAGRRARSSRRRSS